MNTAGSLTNKSINTVVVAGLIVSPIIFSRTGSGAPVCNFTLRTYDEWWDTSGNMQRRNDDHQIAVFGASAEEIEAEQSLGDYLVIRGRLRYAPNGKAEIVAANVGGPEIV